MTLEQKRQAWRESKRRQRSCDGFREKEKAKNLERMRNYSRQYHAKAKARYRAKHPESSKNDYRKHRASRLCYLKAQRETLSFGYVRQLLTRQTGATHLPDELIAAKRQQMKLKRICQHHKTSTN